jgi:creatinine amidohydrolase
MHFKNVCYHLRAADALGFHAAILVTGHYGPNWEDLKTLLAVLQPHFAMRLYGLPDFEANVPGYDGKTGDHAGKVETSLLWALEPECVDVSRFPAPDEDGAHFAMGRDAREANRRIGERMVADEVAWLGEKARLLLADYAVNPPSSRNPLTFMQIETIWAQELLPALHTFKSMQYLDRKPPHEGSIWQLNYAIPEQPAA